MRNSIKTVCNLIAELDAAGVALIVLSSDSFADIAEIAGNYSRKAYREIPLKTPTADKKRCRN